jgi:type VI secretion system protein ImpF
MANPATERTVRLSVIDRLIDTEPRLAADPPVTWAESLRRHKNALLRDVEWLLNTRRTIEPASASYPELRQSVYQFGLPDISSASADSSETPLMLQLHVEETLRLFEPRLTGVQVSLGNSGGGHRRDIRFVVDAFLRLDPDPERMIFDTVLETASGEFHVRGSDDA